MSFSTGIKWITIGAKQVKLGWTDVIWNSEHNVEDRRRVHTTRQNTTDCLPLPSPHSQHTHVRLWTIFVTSDYVDASVSGASTVPGDPMRMKWLCVPQALKRSTCPNRDLVFHKSNWDLRTIRIITHPNGTTLGSHMQVHVLRHKWPSDYTINHYGDLKDIHVTHSDPGILVVTHRDPDHWRPMLT